MRPAAPVNKTVRRSARLAVTLPSSSCREAGVLVGVGGQAGNVVRIQPPLVIADAELDRAIETLDRALTEVPRLVDDGPVREPANVAASAG